MKAIGVTSLCLGSDPVSVVRGQFIKIFDALAAREKRKSLIPAVVMASIENTGRSPLPSALVQTLAGIGAGGNPNA